MKTKPSAPLLRTLTRFLALLLGASGIACAQPGVPSKEPPPARKDVATGTAQMLEAIRAEIGDAACDTDRQCFSVGIGAKACGGPETYLAWSIKSGDRERLLALVSRHREARLKDIERSGMASDCRVMPDPGAVCRPRVPDGQKVCQPGQGGQGRLD